MKLRTTWEEIATLAGKLPEDRWLYDAAAAHALMLAMREWWSASDESGLDEQQSPRETVQWIEARAMANFREWGFDSGEDEG